jgi:hypothetical protein
MNIVSKILLLISILFLTHPFYGASATDPALKEDSSDEEDQDTSEKDKEEDALSFKFFRYDQDLALSHPFVGVIPDQAKGFSRYVRDKEFRTQADHVLKRQLPYLLILGPQGIGKAALAHSIAFELKLALIEIDFETSEKSNNLSEISSQIFELLLKEGLPDKFILFFKGVNALPGDLKFLASTFGKKEAFLIASYHLEPFTLKLEELDEKNKKIFNLHAFFKVQLKTPSKEERKTILKNFLKDIPHALTQEDMLKFLRLFDSSEGRAAFNGDAIQLFLEHGLAEALSRNEQLSWRHLDTIWQHYFEGSVNPLVL